MCFAYTMVYTMVFGVLTCCWDVVHHGFLWYISIFPVIYWVDLGYIPVFTGPYHSAISQRCVIPVLRCDMSDDRLWYSMLYTTFPKAGPLWLPWSGCAGTPRVPVARLSSLTEPVCIWWHGPIAGTVYSWNSGMQQPYRYQSSPQRRRRTDSPCIHSGQRWAWQWLTLAVQVADSSSSGTSGL